MKYILKSREKGCFLCDIFQSRNDPGNLVLRRGKRCGLVMNRYPYNNGHLLAAPYRHVDSLEKMSKTEMTELMTMAGEACNLLKKAMRADGFNLGINLGTPAGAGLKDHLHLHIVPRWEGDTNFMPVMADVKIIPQTLKPLWRQLRKFIHNR